MTWNFFVKDVCFFVAQVGVRGGVICFGLKIRVDFLFWRDE